MTSRRPEGYSLFLSRSNCSLSRTHARHFHPSMLAQWLQSSRTCVLAVTLGRIRQVCHSAVGNITCRMGMWSGRSDSRCVAVQGACRDGEFTVRVAEEGFVALRGRLQGRHQGAAERNVATSRCCAQVEILAMNEIRQGDTSVHTTRSINLSCVVASNRYHSFSFSLLQRLRSRRHGHPPSGGATKCLAWWSSSTRCTVCALPYRVFRWCFAGTGTQHPSVLLSNAELSLREFGVGETKYFGSSQHLL